MRAIDAHSLLTEIENLDFSFLDCEGILEKVKDIVKKQPTVITDEDDSMPRKYVVTKKDGTVEVLLLKNKGEDTWSFVNITKGHICECRFASVTEAARDLDNRLKNGKIEGYARIN